MRNNSFKTSRLSGSKRRRLSLVLNFAAALAACAGMLSIAVPSEARASAELDRKNSLSNIGILQAWDNVDGLFADIVTQSYKRALKDNSRFVVQDLRKANEVLSSSKMPYQKLIEDPEVLAQIVKNYKLDTLLRTRVYKEGPLYRFIVDWIHGPTLDVLASETFHLDEPAGDKGMTGGEQFQSALGEALDRLMKKVPMFGTVTGRDQTAVTVNIGSGSGLKKGDTLVIGTLEEVKKHPLLKQVVEWRMASTGRATVEEVEEGMAFAKIDAEEFGRQIARYQKVVQIIPRQSPDAVDVKTTTTDLDELRKRAEEPPRIGWVAPGLIFGSYGREVSTRSNTGFSGNATTFGVKLDGQLWFTATWFSELNFLYGTGSYSQEQLSNGQSTGAASVTANITQFRVAAGYRYHLSENFFGPQIWGKAGFQSTSFGLPTSSSELRSGASHSGLTIGIGGDLPIRQDYGALLSIDLGLFTGGTEDGGYLRSQTGANALDFFLGGYMWLQPKMKLRLGLDFKSYNLQFVNEGNLDNKLVAFGPSLLFYF